MRTLDEVKDKFEELTDINEHTSALIVVSDFLCMDEVTHKLLVIKNKQNRMGYLTSSFNHQREVLRSLIKEKISENNVDIIV